MDRWPRNPLLYEINTWIWLSELSQQNGWSIDLGSVPAAEWDRVAALGLNAVWLMGVWERSPASVAIANQNEHLVDEFRQVLPDFRPEDNAGSPYAIRRYIVDAKLGGRAGLAVAREQLRQRGMKLLLDFVPNHVAPDHPWTSRHPEYFIQGTEREAERLPAEFLKTADGVFARGRDPYFPPWPDTLQLNTFHTSQRVAAIATVTDIAAQCDGVRCDMAMLVLDSIFGKTWGERAGERPKNEYWAELIPEVKKRYPEFLFIAEAYWDKEWELQQLGFDYCYDKRLYDRLADGTPESIRAHLQADISYQEKLVRFIENHDEPRAAATFSRVKEQAAAVAIATLPGAKLFQDGQLEGRHVRIPVFLARRPAEAADADLYSFYRKLLDAINNRLFREGTWTLCNSTGSRDLLAWSWRRDQEWCLVAVNLGENRVYGRVMLPWDDLAGKMWRLRDALSGTAYERNGDELQTSGLYVELEAGQSHLLLNSAEG